MLGTIKKLRNLLKGRGKVTKRSHKITRGKEEGIHQKITLDYKGGGVNLVQPWHRQSIKENPDFTDENQFFGAKIQTEKLSPE